MLLTVVALPLRSEAASTLEFTVATVEPEAGGQPCGRVLAGNEPVLTLGGHGWRCVTDAAEVARRLNALAEEGLQFSEISVDRDGRNMLIVARGRRIVTVDGPIASLHDSRPEELARAWAKNLRAQFQRPYLSLRPLLVPVGESRRAPVKGVIVGPLTVRSDSPSVTAAYEADSGNVRVVGLQVGRTELVVSDRRNSLRVPVRVARYAARLAGETAAAVTGNPAPAHAISEAVKAALRATLLLEPGAWASLQPWVGEAAPLAPGRTTVVPVRVSAAGEEYLSYHARPTVRVRNEQVPRGPADLLMVSNSPERLRSHGLWFEGRLGDSQSARLLYHHVNAAGVDSELVVELWNLGPSRSRVQVIAGTGGPTRDESWAGHRAASNFLGNRAGNVGWIVEIPPDTATPVLAHSISSGATSSGLLELRALGAANLSVRLYLAPRRSERMAHPITDYLESPLLGQWHYPEARREVSATYVVGRDWAFVTIGNQATPGMVEGDLLAGNYGLIYDISLDLSNPTAEEARVVVLLEPAGGSARATLLVDGQQVETALMQADSQAEVARYQLAPGERRRVRIQTMPEGGSNYPVRLVARAL